MVKRSKHGQLPNAAEVMAAIEAAARITKADPADVIDTSRLKARGVAPASIKYARASRARYYATFALRAIFEDGSQHEIARLCGVKDNKNLKKYFYNADSNMSEGCWKFWWSDDAFMSVIEAVEAFQAAEAAIREQEAAE